MPSADYLEKEVGHQMLVRRKERRCAVRQLRKSPAGHTRPRRVAADFQGDANGLFEGAAVTLSAMWVTACIQFLLARRLGGERLRKRLGDQLGRIGLLLERRGALAVAGGRLLPGPFSELNMAAGLTPLTFRDFAVGTLLGCAPRAAAWSAVGAALG
jgi:uncharacterized membrane protein YdjX (TVP38/TMEM64 family)